MDVALFDFDLPEAQIALRPVSPRDSARMMVVEAGGRIAHRTVRDLPDYLQAGDALLVNDTRVIPARLHGLRLRDTGPAKIEILLHRRLAGDRYRVLARPARKLAVGDALQFGPLQARVAARGDSGEAEITFALSGAALDAAIAAQGEMPLPPYIMGKRTADARDMSDYQTLFARQDGSVAAPTAGLHFTPGLFAALDEKGVGREAVTLHVGLGTFLPVTAADTAQHRMHAETGQPGRRHGGAAERGPCGGRAHRRGGDHQPAHPGKRRHGGRRHPSVRWRNRHFHHPRLSFPRRRHAAHQFSSAALHPVHAGQRPDGAGDDEGGLCARPSRRGIASIPMAMPVC